MGRAAKKRKRQAVSRAQDKAHGGSAKLRLGGRGGLVVLFVVIVGGLAWYGSTFWISSQKDESTFTHPTPEPPPIDAARVLGVCETIPEDVEGLRGEVMAVCEMLRRDLPDRPETHSMIALTHYWYGVKDEAFAEWQQALQLKGDFSPAHLGLGLVAADNGRDKEAITALRRTIELNPSTEEAYAKLVEVLLRENEADEALKVGQEFARRFPENRKATYWLGQCYLQLERYEDAANAHEAVIRNHPDLTPSYYSLAVALARLGRRDEAAKARVKFAELKERDLAKQREENRTYVDTQRQKEILAETHLSAGNVYLHNGNLTKAEAHWLRGAQVRSEEIGCRKALAEFYQSQERWRSLAKVASEWTTLSAGDRDAWLQLATAHAHLGESEEAEMAYRRAISLAPDSALAYLGLLRFSLQANRELPDAAALARKAVVLAPSPDSYLLMSAVLDLAGDRAGALAATEEALRLAPNHPQLQQVYRELQHDR